MIKHLLFKNNPEIITVAVERVNKLIPWSTEIPWSSIFEVFSLLAHLNGVKTIHRYGYQFLLLICKAYILFFIIYVCNLIPNIITIGSSNFLWYIYLCQFAFLFLWVIFLLCGDIGTFFNVYINIYFFSNIYMCYISIF